MFKTLVTFSLLTLLTSSFNNAYALSLVNTRHLLTKTGFAPSFDEIEPFLALTKAEAIDHIFTRQVNQIAPALPTIFSVPYLSSPLAIKLMTQDQKKAYRKERRQQTQLLQAWWIDKMLTTSNPVTENLTLFWHNHFATSLQKVKHPALMAVQNQTLRKHAKGNFKTFLHAMIKDPALLLYLDNNRNRNNKPNENLARELMELFTLGEGHYTEADVKNGALALSGYGFKHKRGTFVFNTRQHNNTVKNILGYTGNWNGDDFIDILLKQKQTARFIIRKLWAHYITTPIPLATLTRLTDGFYQNYEITPLLQNILQQPDFWHKDNQGTQLKSPVQLVIGFYRQFNLKPNKAVQLSKSTQKMGQRLFYPPNVKGWPTGNNWINSTTLLARQNFITQVTRGMKLKNAIRHYDKNPADWIDLIVSHSLHKENTKTNDHWQTVKNTLGDLNYQLQ